MRNERTLKIVIAVAWSVLVLFLIGLGLKLLNEFVLAPEQAISLRFPGTHEPRRLQSREIRVFFANEDASALVHEKRSVELGAGMVSDAEAVMAELLKGPQMKGSFPTIPADTRVLNIYEVDELLVLDFTREIQANHTGGTASEIMTVYSIVNTVVANLEGIRAVQILVEGNEAETLAGHLDISRPLSPNLKWMHALHYETAKEPRDESERLRGGTTDTLRNARASTGGLRPPPLREPV